MVSTILSENTDEIIALVVVGSTMLGYFISVSVPTEPLMLVLGYYFGKKMQKD
jgi:F0F1-type ATP synthase assembly protein I